MSAPKPPANDDQRVAALERSGALAEAPRASLRAIAEEAARRAGTPAALVTFIAADNAWIQAAAGASEGQIGRDSAFCAWAVHSLEVLWVEDAFADARFSDNPLVVSDPFIRFYAGAPIAAPEGYALGAICVIDYVPRAYVPDTSKMLQDLSLRISDILAQEAKESSP